MSTHIRSWRHRFAVAALLAASAFVCGPAWGQAAPFSKWFKYDADIGKEWDVAGDPANPMVVSINRKDGVGPVRRVLVLYPRASSAYDTAITEILRTFSAKEINASVDVINFELNDAKGKASLSGAEQNRTELVFGMGSESAAWLYQNYMKGKLPVVTVCAKDPVQLGQMKDYESGSGNNFAFTSLNVPVDVQMSYVRDLRPDLKNIAVLVDSKNISAVQTQAEPVADYLKGKGVQVIIGAVQNPANARQELVKIVGDAVRKMRQTDPDLSKSLFWVTGSTSVFREIRTINEHADRVPGGQRGAGNRHQGRRHRRSGDRRQLREQCAPRGNLRRADSQWRQGRADEGRAGFAARHRDQLPEGARHRHARAVQLLRDRELRLRL